MKKIILVSILVHFLFADYYIFKSQTSQHIQTPTKEIFFGEFDKWQKNRESLLTKNDKIYGGLVTFNAALEGYSNSLNGGSGSGTLLGAVIGATVGILTRKIALHYRKDQMYILVKKDTNGELISYFFEGNKHPSYSIKQIKKYIQQFEKTNKPYIYVKGEK